ncbi:hypothetical protein ID854_21985, partial [Xenorhabdus sp. M]
MPVSRYLQWSSDDEIKTQGESKGHKMREILRIPGTREKSVVGVTISAYKINSYKHVADAPRKSYLGKARRLTPTQERWVKAILTLWADEMGGKVYSGGYGSGGCDGIWRFVSGWSEEQQEKFMTIFEWLRNGGYRGEELLKKAHMILFPKQSLSVMFQRANDVDEADFVEKAILKAFSKSNPIYVLATDYYLRRNTVQTLANYMQSDIAPWLT